MIYSWNSNFIPLSFSATESQEEEVEFTDPPKLVQSSKFVQNQQLDQNNDVHQLMRAEDLVLNIDWKTCDLNYIMMDQYFGIFEADFNQG